MSFDSILKECRLSNVDHEEIKFVDDLGSSYYAHTSIQLSDFGAGERDYYQNYSGAYQQPTERGLEEVEEASGAAEGRLNRFDNSGWSPFPDVSNNIPGDDNYSPAAADLVLDRVHSLTSDQARIQNRPSSISQ